VRSSKIGAGAILEPFAHVSSSVIGDSTIIRKLCNIFNSEVGSNSRIGAFTEVGGAVIGSSCSIQAHVFICEGVEIGDNVFIGPHVCFTNDKYPPSGKRWKTIVGDYAAIGANATIVCGITVGEGSEIGAGSVVTKSVPDGEVWVGNPARFLRKRSK